MGKSGKARYVCRWTQDAANREISVPTKIKCGRCSKNLSHLQYSDRQLTDAELQILDTGMIQNVKCRACIGERATELECMMCEKIKGLEEFSKTQRRSPDTAKCWKCIEIQVKEEAVDPVKYENPHAAFRPPKPSDGVQPSYYGSTMETSSTCDTEEWDKWNMINEQQSTRYKKKLFGDDEDGCVLLPDLVELSLSGSSASKDGQSTAQTYNGKEASESSWHTGSAGPPSASSRFDPSKYSTSSATSVSGSTHSFGISQAGRSPAPVRSGGWVKKSEIPRGPSSSSAYQGSPMLPMGDLARNSESSAWSDDDEEEDDDYDSDDNTEI